MTTRIFEKDVFDTSMGSLRITFIGHGSLMLELKGKVIHVDPYGELADYSLFPRADIILGTHEHFDHMDLNAIDLIRKSETNFICTEACSRILKGAHVMKNGDTYELDDIHFEAVPAYNIAQKRDDGQPFHPPGEGNGYILTIGNTRLYIAGDTEDIPEMVSLKNIDIAFLPMNLPYTMTPEMVARAALIIKPRILYPYHFGQTSTEKLIQLLKDESNIEVRIRNMA